jgi:hypothetical protein
MYSRLVALMFMFSDGLTLKRLLPTAVITRTAFSRFEFTQMMIPETQIIIACPTHLWSIDLHSSPKDPKILCCKW